MIIFCCQISDFLGWNWKIRYQILFSNGVSETISPRMPRSRGWFDQKPDTASKWNLVIRMYSGRNGNIFWQRVFRREWFRKTPKMQALWLPDTSYVSSRRCLSWSSHGLDRWPRTSRFGIRTQEGPSTSRSRCTWVSRVKAAKCTGSLRPSPLPCLQNYIWRYYGTIQARMECQGTIREIQHLGSSS